MDPVKLMKLEIIALLGVQSRDREIQEKYIKPLQQDLTAILDEITERVRETDSNFEFGRTHKLDFTTLEIMQITDAEKVSVNT